MYKQALKTIYTLLPQTGNVSVDAIENAVDMTLSIPLYAGLERDKLIKELMSVYSILIENFRIIESDERKRPWISANKSGIKWDFWNRYRDYLAIDKGYPDSVLNQLDRLTDRTLDGLFNPGIDGIIDKRGLVVGHVQSGKTSNYTGLICKAADAGFKLIIVLAGVHNNLRSQTQLRIDEGFLCFDTQHERALRENTTRIGAGKYNTTCIAHSLTSSISDFSAGAANSLGLNFNIDQPIIAVVKKNGKILERLLKWLSSQTVENNGRRIIQNKSLLLIDDEADNASINTRPDNDGTTRINGLIRDILRLFDKSGYVGYTATPFANIFIPIEEDELFPRDFIINLPAPSNYIGPDKIFGFKLSPDNEASDSVLPIVHRINDFQSLIPATPNNGDPLPDDLPVSLVTAMKCFMLTCAVRRLRGQVDVHNSMLVHVSRLLLWQNHITELVQNIFDYYRRGIEMSVPSIIEEMRIVYEEDSSDYKSFKTTSRLILESDLKSLDHYVQVHGWDEVLLHLNDAVSRIQVRQINGGSADALNYYDNKNGLSVIAVGGDKLSRGLTLEGLSVSYYLRASRMYDTLMQMGRWFGYRSGYVDLCRLFTSRDLNEWFCHISLASDDLRDEFDYLSDVVGSTPLQYALRVRTHPGVLQISASNKIRRAQTVQVSWSGRLIETYELSKNPEVISKNLEITKKLINRLGSANLESNYYLWKGIPFSYIKEFLSEFNIHNNLKSASPKNLLKFIEFKYGKNELQAWNIGIITKQKGRLFNINDSINVNLIERNQDKEYKDSDIYFIRKSHIISPDDEFIDLSSEEIKEAEILTKRKWKEKGRDGDPKRLDGNCVRNQIRKPNKVLLLLYFLNPSGAELPPDSEPVVGFAISFPGTDRNDAIAYAVNSQLLDVFNNDDLFDENEDEDED
jgi:hypothetical protein